MAQQRETLLKSKVAADLKKIDGLWFEKIQQRAKIGTPDFLICAEGWFVALELKLDKEQVSNTATMALQDLKLRRIAAAGGHAFKVDAKNWPAVRGALLLLISETRNEKQRLNSRRKK